jgi:acyl-CoA hydrolase
MDRLDFLAPIRQGYIVEIEAHINYVSHSSMEIELNVSAEDTLSGKHLEACHAYFTLVALDSAGKPSPVPQLELQGEEEYKRFQAAKNRHDERLKKRTR